MDDEAPIRDILRRGIEGGAFKVTTAASGNEALALLGQKRFDVVLTDIHMESPGGLELTRLIREKHPHIDVIILTGYATMDTVIKAFKIGAYDYLAKPLDLILVKAALRRCLDKQAYQAQLKRGERLALELQATLLAFCEKAGRADGPALKEACRTLCDGLPRELAKLVEGLRGEASAPPAKSAETKPGADAKK